MKQSDFLGRCDLKYLRIYVELIKKFKGKPIPYEVDTELHHVIPRCIGLEDYRCGGPLVMLPIREHIMAHLLLHKAFPECTGFLFAANAMFNLRDLDREEALNRFSARTIQDIRSKAGAAMRKHVPFIGGFYINMKIKQDVTRENFAKYVDDRVIKAEEVLSSGLDSERSRDMKLRKDLLSTRDPYYDSYVTTFLSIGKNNELYLDDGKIMNEMTIFELLKSVKEGGIG